MRHVRILGLCLVAVLAIAAVATSSASALPEWGKCVAQPGGKYTDSNCTTKGKGGSFEWKKGKTLAPVPFTGEGVGGGGVLYTAFSECAGGTYNSKKVSNKKCIEGGGKVNEFNETSEAFKVECEKENATGEASGSKEVKNVSVTFKGCTLFGAFPCQNEGAAEGEVKTNALKGSLGYINKAAKEVGVLLEPVKKHGTFAEFECAVGVGIVTTVGVGNTKQGAAYSPESHGGYDGIISPVTPVNEMTNEYTQVYTVNGKTQNIPQNFEGKHIELLEDALRQGSLSESEIENESSKWARGAEEITNVNTPAEPGEIKA